MGKKIIVIHVKTCYLCPYYYTMCGKTADKIVLDPNDIPDWCPLEDADD